MNKTYYSQCIKFHQFWKLKVVKRRIFPSRSDKMELEKALKKRINFYSQFISSNDLCFDVGANIGNRVEPLLSLNAKVVAVEPQEKCCEILRRKFGNKISLEAKGLGEKEEEKIFYISDISVLSSFSEEWIDSVENSKRFGSYKWRKAQLMKITTLDILIKKYGVP
ncbi:methyltransferase, FkbM family [Bacteroidales bacterium Barb6]|nr:methyltransferase, FkbM family [Bacteroidales bacterium Barb6]